MSTFDPVIPEAESSCPRFPRAVRRLSQALVLVGLVRCHVAVQDIMVGTAIVVLKTANSFVIGADSREVRKAGSGTIASDGACKIAERSGVVFALADLAALPGGTSVMAIAKRVMALPITARRMVAEFERLTIPVLEQDPSYLERFPYEVVNGTSVMEFLFARIENGRPTLEWADFKVRIADPRGHIAPEGGELKDDGLLFARARSLRERADVRLDPAALKDRRLAAAEVKRLVSVVASDPANSQFVGGLTDIVTVGPTGITWQAQKPACKQ